MSGRALPPARLLAVVAPVSLVGVAAYIAATFSFFKEPGTATTIVGVSVFLIATILAECFPVPLEGADAYGVSLGFVLAVASTVLFGWAPTTFMYVTGTVIAGIILRRSPMRTIFNGGEFAIFCTLAALASSQFTNDDALTLLVQVAVVSAIIYFVNVILVTAAIAAAGSDSSYFRLIRSTIRWTAIPIALMASAALMLVVLWERTPYLVAALVGPLVAISLYQRSTHKALNAIRLSLTDPLTGLGNHRHFHERLQRELATAEDADSSVSLAFLDVDDFKRINDQFGHPAGDRVLSQVAGRLRQGGEAFRLGGDEFAVLLPATDEKTAVSIAGSIIERIHECDLGEIGTITVSAGVATYPHHSRERDSLIRLTDGALYWAKEHGKNQVRAARADVVDLSEFRRVAETTDRNAKFQAAASLARAIDQRDAYTGSHSERVASISVAISQQLGLSSEDVELTRLAASLHDLGKLAIPEEILRKPTTLTEAEWVVVQHHPQIGHRMLESLGIDPIADWVLHHHERWDGAGYPDRLVGDSIPLGSRIVFVADAFDAMTSERDLPRVGRTRRRARRARTLRGGTVRSGHRSGARRRSRRG